MKWSALHDAVSVVGSLAGLAPEPMRAEVRSLNLATSAALALGEALRQTGGLPEL